MKNKFNFSKYKNIFCDSSEALKWAYENGLSKEALIQTSSPKLLLEKNPYIKNIESDWTLEKIKEFQSSIEKFSIDIYKSIFNSKKYSHEESLCAALFALKIQNLIYKAACLKAEDLFQSRLFLAVKGKGGRSGNFMNAPWKYLLDNNPNFEIYSYNLANEIDQSLTTKGVSKRIRFLIGGWETFIYRLALRIYKILPHNFFSKQVLIVNENELIIESAAYLARKGIKIKKIKLRNNLKINSTHIDPNLIVRKIIPTLENRINKWVIPELRQKVQTEAISIFKNQITEYYQFFTKWSRELDRYKNGNNILFINSPASISGIAITGICRNKNIKVVSMQHGVSKEINEVHSTSLATYEINLSDLFIAFNQKSADASKKSYFAIGDTFVSGVSNRLSRMSYSSAKPRSNIPIAYVSTNLYTANFGIINSHITDYQIAKNEKDIIKNILGKLPHKILYKAYPEENKRYPDKNPILDEAKLYENIELFEDVVDMRYFIWKYRVFITSRATSTLSWLVFSGKPIIFINWINDNSLKGEAYDIFDKAIFVFNSNDKDFYFKLLRFLSKPIKEIELLYSKKRKYREMMIKKYFSTYKGGAGKRISETILELF